jgi:Tfp pilus tip-associated adhesin PilY1
MKLGLKRLLLAFALAAFYATPFAVFDPVHDDTDLFRNNPNIPAERPNVLIILDNTANWNTAFTNEKSALVSVVNGLDDAYNLGLMLFPETGGGNDSIDGGYVKFGMRQMTTANKSALATIVGNLDKLADKGNNSTIGLAMHEAYLYFGGRINLASFGKVKTDFAGNTVNNPLAAALAGNALPASPTAASLYTPAISDACQKNYIIFISNGPTNENASARSTAETLLTAARGGSAPPVIAISPNGQQANWADEYAKFMAENDINGTFTGSQTAITYVVEVDPGSTGQAPDMTALAKSMAQNGKGKYFAVTSGGTGQAIIDALNAIFQEIQAVNSVFAASTLPVSVNVRGTNLNQLYIGVFRPDSSDKPRWLGNLKAYQLKKDATTGAVFTVDANLNPAINSSTGFITSSAVSFWTAPSLPNSTYWSFRPAAANGVGGNSDSPDGDLVEKGGAAQQLRATYFASGINGVSPDPSRPLYTCTQGPAYPVCDTNYSGTSSLLSATPFVDANTDIDAGSLAIDTRQVSPLTAGVTKPITALKDTRPVTLDNTSGAVFLPYTIQTNSDSRYYFTLDNTRTVSVTSLSNGAVAKTLSSITVANGANKVAVATSTAHGLAINQTVVISGTTSFNGNRVITAVTANTFSFGSFTGTLSESGTAVTSNTTVIATAPAHGFATSTASTSTWITIAGATPTSFNGAKQITVLDANTFTYANSVSSGATGTFTATGLSDTVTATLDTSWGFASHGHTAGQTITINNSVPSTYDGTYVVLSSPAPTATRFSFKTPTTITTPSTGNFVYTTFSGSVATPYFNTATNPGFVNGATVFISGGSPPGFNGTFTISNVIDYGNYAPFGNCCPGFYSFEYTVPSGLGFSAGVATPGVPIQVAGATSSTVTAQLVNHRFSNGMSITIAGALPTSHNGTWTVSNIIDNDTFQYSTGVALNAPSGAPTARRTSSPRAYATIVGHGYGAANTTINNFIVAGATPSGYNGDWSARIDDANTVRYTLSSALGTNTGSPVTATTYGTTAVATSTAHGFSAGQTVTISGATPSAFNGAHTIVSVPDLDTFTYTIGSAQGAATGSINALSSGAGASERTKVINWVRGEDNFEDENANSSFADTRASMHGDVLHSRPAVVNYNRRAASDPANADNDVYIYYGGNDGVFRGIKGGFGSTTGDPSAGAEVWGFIAKEHFGNLKRLRLNSPAISSNFKKPYFFDGPIGAYTLDSNNDGKLVAADGDKVWLFLTMRRGGRAIYALDVSDPLVPKMLWRKGCPSLSLVAADIDAVTGCDLGWGELGQTWSEPKVISINATADPVLMFGAGYDALVEDQEPSSITSVTSSNVVAGGTTYTRSMGRGIYVVNARTGAIIWQATGQARADSSTHPFKNVSGMSFAIPSDIAVVLGDSTPKPFRSYVGDTGGNMWRIDFGDADPTKWTVVKLASVADLTTVAGRRKFLFPPDVIGSATSDMVISGTGDREHPFDTTVVNRVYAFKDTVRSTTPAANVGTGVPLQATITHTATATFNGSTVSTLLNVTTNCIQVAANCSGTAPELAVGGSTASQNTASALAASTNVGWFITLAAGEKQVGGTLGAGGGAVFFGTNQPSSSAGGGACSPNLGVARQYSINFENGTAFTGTSLSTTYAGGGFLPSPVLVFVGLGGATGTGSGTSGGVPVGGTVSGGQLKIGAGASLGGGNDPTGVVCYGASCAIAPGKQLYSRLRKFWYKEID